MCPGPKSPELHALFCIFKTLFKFSFDVAVQTADPYGITGFIIGSIIGFIKVDYYKQKDSRLVQIRSMKNCNKENYLRDMEQ